MSADGAMVKYTNITLRDCIRGAYGVRDFQIVGPDGKPMPPEPLPSVFDTVKQYGLRLDARKAPIEMLTVTHLEKTPTEN